MPLYEYLCRSCDTEFEVLRPMSKSAEAAECPDCEGPGQRLLSVFAASTSSTGGEVAPIAGGAGCACGGACSCAA